jgi:hypothetical protein
MANVYIEPRPKGHLEGSHIDIDDYLVEDHPDHVLATFKTQREADRGRDSRPCQDSPVARMRAQKQKRMLDSMTSAIITVSHKGMAALLFTA